MATTVSSGSVTTLFFPEAAILYVIPATGGKASFNGRTVDGSAIAPREFYSEGQVSISAGSTVSIEAANGNASYIRTDSITLLEMLARTGEAGVKATLSDYPSAPPFRWDATDGHWKAVGGRFNLAKVGAQTTVTGTTSPTAAYTITIPGGLIGKYGTLELDFLYNINNDASNKTLSVLYGGTQFATAGGGSLESLQSKVRITNQGSNSVQVCHTSITVPEGGTQTELTRGAVNSGADQTLEFRITLADGTDTAILEDIVVSVVHGG